jgi:hypothetical protein
MQRLPALVRDFPLSLMLMLVATQPLAAPISVTLIVVMTPIAAIVAAMAWIAIPRACGQAKKSEIGKVAPE